MNSNIIQNLKIPTLTHVHDPCPDKVHLVLVVDLHKGGVLALAQQGGLHPGVPGEKEVEVMERKLILLVLSVLLLH